MESLSVGVLIDTVYPFTHGGAEKRYALLLEELAARGHDVTVYAMKWWPGALAPPRGGVRHVGVGAPRPLYADHARRSLVQPLSFAVRALQAMRGAKHDLGDCNQFPFVHLPAAKLGAVLRGHPIAITWHEVWRDYWFDYAPFPAAMLGSGLEYAAPHLGHNIAVSHHTAARLRDLGARPESVSVVPNAIDLARIDRLEARSEPTDIVFAGRLIAHKRVDRLLAAVARLRHELPGVRCTILGSGPEEARLRALSHGLGLADNVEFTGSLHDEDALLATMKAARLFVSSSEREGFGIAALEAMACRLPVVTIAAPMNALAEELVLDRYNGVVVREPRARALAEALALALGDEPGRRRLAAKARLTAEGYDKGRVARRLEAVYHRILDRPAPPPEHAPPAVAPLLEAR